MSLRLDDLKQHFDVLRARDGEKVTVRFIEPRDADELQAYYRSLSARSRYNRFLGAISELPKSMLDHFTQIGLEGGFTVVATMDLDDFETIVGEARYAFHADSGGFEFGMSIDDRWQRHGIGLALLKNLECRAAALGAEYLFGDTLRSNDAMLSLARKSGFSFTHHPDDWKLVRFNKGVGFENLLEQYQLVRSLRHRVGEPGTSFGPTARPLTCGEGESPRLAGRARGLPS